MLGATIRLEGTANATIQGATKAASKKASVGATSDFSSVGSSVVTIVVRRPREVVDIHRENVDYGLDVIDGDEVGLGDNGHRRDRDLGRITTKVRSSGTCESIHASTSTKGVDTTTKTEILGSSRGKLEEDHDGNRSDQESRLEDRRHVWLVWVVVGGVLVECWLGLRWVWWWWLSLAFLGRLDTVLCRAILYPFILIGGEDKTLVRSPLPGWHING
ncbi:MAG: hypothetical protein JOS17DRAFT_741999 [Linnemannia elongata]|nr:MAG: hypothetical protein JOS17DRAFT_741999 [Linnemannia elongata]